MQLGVCLHHDQDEQVHKHAQRYLCVIKSQSVGLNVQHVSRETLELLRVSRIYLGELCAQAVIIRTMNNYGH